MDYAELHAHSFFSLLDGTSFPEALVRQTRTTLEECVSLRHHLWHNQDMAKPDTTLEKIIAGSKNVRFDDFARVLEMFGFELVRSRG